MITFLKMVAAAFIALLLLLLIVYFWIKWKFRGFMEGLSEALRALGAGGVPPFRIKFKQRSEVYDDDEDEESVNQEEFEECCQQFLEAGFDKIEDYYVEEIGMPLTAFVHRETSTYGVVYDHPVANVFCDVTRRYHDQTSITYS